jgi:5-methylcytosine-specific restriction endonuclease McrA
MSKGGNQNSCRKRANKVSLYQHQDGLCALCGQPMPDEMHGPKPGVTQPPETPTMDHIVRRRDGGTWAKVNMQLVHKKCNQERD